MRLSELTLGDLKSAPVPSPTRAPTKAPMRLSDLTSADIDDSKSIMSDSIAAGVKGATVPDVGLIPTYNRANAALRTGVKTLNENWYNPSGALPQALYAMGKQGIEQSAAPTAEAVFDASPASGLLKNESFKKSFSDTPMGMPVKLGLLPFVGSEEASKIAGNIPEQAGRLITAGETDALSYVPGAVFEKPLAVAGKVASKLPGAGTVGKAMAWGAEQTTGVGRKLWEHYAKHADEIGQMAKEYVGENRYLQAFKDIRQKWSGATEARKSHLGQMIEGALKEAPQEKNISVQPILDRLNEAKSSLHPELHASDAAEIDSMINMIAKVAPEGNMSAYDAYHIQRYLHDRAGKAFSSGGQIFNTSPRAAKAAKSARYEATQIVNDTFPDTIKRANQEYVELHNIDDIIPKSILDPEGSTAALTRGAMNPSSREAEAMKRLGKFLYGDENAILHEAKNAATFEKMTNLPLNPLSGGGTTSTSRTVLGGLIGAGSQMSDDPVVKGAGAAVGGAIASPVVTKMALDMGLLAPRAAKAVAGKGGLLEKGAERVSPYLKALDKRITPYIDEAAGTAKEFIKDEKGEFTPSQIKGLLKKEGTYDLKKAREVAGPAKGLLPGEAGGVINAESGLQNTKIDQVLGPLKDLEKKVRAGESLTQSEVQFLNKAKDKMGFGGPLVDDILELNKFGKNPNIEVVGAGYQPKDKSLWQLTSDALGRKILELPNLDRDATRKVGAAWDAIDNIRKNASLDAKQKSDAINHVHQNLMSLFEGMQPEQPRGLLTSLNVEKGPVKELPEAGKIVPMREAQPIPGSRARREMTEDYAFAQENGAFLTAGRRMQLEGWKKDILEHAKKSGGRPSQFDLETVDKIDEVLRKNSNFKKEVAPITQKRMDAEKAEAERLKKNVVSLDVGKAKAKPSGPAIGEVWNSPSGKEYKVLATEKEGGKTYVKVEHTDVSGGRNDGKKITTWEDADDSKIFYGRKSRGESGPPGKKELIDSLMSGEKKVPGIKPKGGGKPTIVDVPYGGSVTLKKAQSNSAYNSNPKFEVAEALDDGTGYLVLDPENNRTFEVKHEDISGVFNDKGKPVKPTKPKGKK